MKKLLVLIASAALVFSTAAVSMAATVTVGGEMTMTYDMNDEDGSKDENEAILKFAAKLDDQTSAFVDFKANGSNPTEFEGADKKTSYKENVWVNQSYAVTKTAFGSFKYGMWESKFYNTKLIDNENSVIGKIKPTIGLNYTTPELIDGLTAGVWYWADGNKAKYYDAKEENCDDAYGLGLMYKKGIIDASVYYVDGIRQTVNGLKNYNKDEDAYVLNLTVAAIKTDDLSLNGLVHYGQNEAEQDVCIVGFNGTYGKFYYQAEYDLDDETHKNYDDEYDWNARCARVGYQLTNNLKFEYRWRQYNQNNIDSQIRCGITF